MLKKVKEIFHSQTPIYQRVFSALVEIKHMQSKGAYYA